MEKKKQIMALAIFAMFLVAMSGMVSATSSVDGTLGYSVGREDAYTPSVKQPLGDTVIRLGVWWPRYEGDLPPYEHLAAAGIEASDVVDLNADTLSNYDVVYIGRGAFHVHTGEGDMDVEALKDWIYNGGAIIGESESVIYDSVPTLGVDWSPQLSYVCGVWSTEANACDYVAGNITVTLNPEHPISNGLPESFSTTVYSIEDAAYLDLGRNPTAQEVGTVESARPGIPPIIASSYGSGRAVYFPYCPDGRTNWSSVGGQLLEQLFINAVKWAAGEAGPSISISTDSFEYSPGDTMTVTLDIANPTEDSVTFEWYIGVPQLDIWVTYASVSIPAGFDNSYTIPIPVGDWGPTPFGLVHYVHMLDPVSGDVLVQDVALCAYSPGVGEAMPVDIEEAIMKTIERVELPN